MPKGDHKFEFEVWLIVSDEVDRMSRPLREWLAPRLADPKCVVMNATRPLYADWNPGDPQSMLEKYEGADGLWGTFVAAVYPERDKWNRGYVGENYALDAHVIQVVDFGEAQRIVLDGLPPKLQAKYVKDSTWNGEAGLWARTWRTTFDSRWRRSQKIVVDGHGWYYEDDGGVARHAA